jgi:shikimate kinase
MRTTLARLMDERYPVYAEADITVISGDGPHDDVVTQILQLLPEAYRELAAKAKGGDHT